MDLADVFHQAMELRLEKRFEEELQVLLAAAGEHEDDLLWIELANWYADRGLRRHDALAMADFVEADQWAELPVTRAGLAAIHARRGEFERAEAQIQKALTLDPELPEAFAAQGELRFRQGDLVKAAEAAAQALKLNPKYGRGYVLLAEILSAGGAPDKAGAVLEAGAAQCSVNDDALLVALARRYAAQEDLARAARALDEAVALNPENPDAWRERARVAALDGSEEQTREALEKASALDREGTLAWIAKESSTLPGLNASGT